MRVCDEITYDGEVDALYLHLMCEWSARATDVTIIPSGPGINVDVVDGQVVGIEVLNASRHPHFRQMIPPFSGAHLQRFRMGGVH